MISSNYQKIIYGTVAYRWESYYSQGRIVYPAFARALPIASAEGRWFFAPILTVSNIYKRLPKTSVIHRRSCLAGSAPIFANGENGFDFANNTQLFASLRMTGWFIILKIYNTYTLCVILSGAERSRSFAKRSEWSKTKERSDAGISFDFSMSYL